MEKLIVEIWSDIMCPFCYIGKRKFETALSSFPNKEAVEIVWHSFQLDPSLTHKPGKDIYSYVAEIKGQTLEWSINVHESVVKSAQDVGLTYNFDKAKITNSFEAHQVIQLAKKHNLGNEIEERFFRAYFTEGELMSDHKTLIRLATEVGLDRSEVTEALETGAYASEVKTDIAEARKLGVNSVPFFVLNRKYAVSGAQDPALFLQALTTAYSEAVTK